MNQIVPVQQTALSFNDIERLASYIAKSKLFGMQTPEQAVALMMIAQAEGRHPALAARDYHIIQNRPSKKAEAMLRDFLMSGGKVEWHVLTDTRAEATFAHPQGGTVKIDWDMDRAKAAGVLNNQTWRTYPRAMLRSRVVAEGVRTVWPLATSGMYVPEEVQDMTATEPLHRGPTLDGRAEPASVPTAAETLNDSIPVLDEEPVKAAPRPTLRDVLRADLAAATSAAEVLRIAARSPVERALREAPPAVRDEIQQMLAEAYARFQMPVADDDLAGLEEEPVT